MPLMLFGMARSVLSAQKVLPVYESSTSRILPETKSRGPHYFTATKAVTPFGDLPTAKIDSMRPARGGT